MFRNGSAYTRWDEGRKTFAKMTSIVRSLSRTVWINVGAAGPSRGRLASDGTLRPHQDEGMKPEDHEDKVKVLRMMVAFVVAVKHHVRREYGVDWPGASASSLSAPLASLDLLERRLTHSLNLCRSRSCSCASPVATGRTGLSRQNTVCLRACFAVLA